MWAVISSMWAVASSMWADTAFIYDGEALCGMLHPLTLTITIKKARNPNPITVAATRQTRRRVAATVIRLGFLDTDMYLNQY